MKVPFLDLRIRDDVQRQELLKAVDTVLQHGMIVMGPEVKQLEEKVAARCNRKYGVSVNSGTTALFLTLKSLGIGPGDDVITTSLSWIATANAIALTGARPVFADIREDLNIDPVSIERLITPRTRVILPVHYTGKICQMSAIMDIAKRHDLMVVEDAAQAFDASYSGHKAGSFGIAGCFSMNPMKVFAACGDAGMIVTDRQDIYERLLALRYNGTVGREKCMEPSLNGRMDTLQAAILLIRLDGVDGIIRKRREIASWYKEQLSGVVKIPQEAEGEWDVYYTYIIQVSRRDELKGFLETRGIETKIQHPYLMPEQPAYQNTTRGDFLNAKRLVKQILSLPVHEKLTRKMIDYVAVCILEFYRGDR